MREFHIVRAAYIMVIVHGPDIFSLFQREQQPAMVLYVPKCRPVNSQIITRLVNLLSKFRTSTAPNTQVSGAVYIKGGSKSNTFEYTTAIYTTLFSLAITLYQQPAFHFFPTLLLFLSYSVSYLSNPRSTHLYSDPYSIPG